MMLEKHGRTISAISEESPYPEMEGPSLRLPWGEGSTHSCLVDIVDGPWPDAMGSDEAEPGLISNAHMLGAYGPCVHPGALERAATIGGLTEVKTAAREQHHAFIRIRLTGTLLESSEHAGNEPAATAPSPTEVLLWMAGIAAQVGVVPGAMGYFNPNGEVLLSIDSLIKMMDGAATEGLYPVPVLISVRHFQSEPGWTIADTVGMGQFGLPDHEMAISQDESNPGEYPLFLINLCHYQITSQAIIHGGETTTGPDDTLWRAQEADASRAVPARAVLHWTKEDTPREPSPDDAAATGEPDAETASDRAIHDLIRITESLVTQSQAMQRRAAQWIKSPAFQSQFYDDVHTPSAARYFFEKEMSKKEAKEVWKSVETLGVQSPELWAQYQGLATEGQLMFAAAVITNPAFAQTPNDSVPCYVVVAHEQTASGIARSTLLAHIAGQQYVGLKDAAVSPKITALMKDDAFRLFRRDPVPPEEFDGNRGMFMSVQLRKSWMPPETIPFIPLLVQPGPRGAVIQIPWHIATGKPLPASSKKEAQWAELAALDREVDRMVEAKNNSLGAKLWRFISWIVYIIVGAGILFGMAGKFMEWLDTPKTKVQHKVEKTQR